MYIRFSDDEHVMLEIHVCRRHQVLNQNIHLKGVHFVGLRYTVVSQRLLRDTSSRNTPLPPEIRVGE
jgi:hypothetical protein